MLARFSEVKTYPPRENRPHIGPDFFKVFPFAPYQPIEQDQHP